jgi:pyrimidine operon attenuation protein/uracil phosphoribosyltransferase
LPAPANSRAKVYHAASATGVDSVARRTATPSWRYGASASSASVLGYAPMRVVEKRQLLSADEIGRTLQRLAHEIVEKSGGTDDLAFIGVRRRGVPLSERLAKTILSFSGVQIPVGTIDITLYRDDLSTVGPQPVVHSNEISFSVDNRDLVIVDDVLFTGRTIRAAMNGLFDLGRPKRIRLCVLIDRGHRELPVEASFIGSKVQTSDTEIVEVHLREIDGDERVVLVDRVSE